MADVVPLVSIERPSGDEHATRTLIRAGWKPRVRCDRTVWKRPGPPPQFYYGQAVALAIVEAEQKEDSS